MRKSEGNIFFSTSDIVNFSKCSFLTSLDYFVLDHPKFLSLKSDPSKYAELIQENGKKHESKHWDELRNSTPNYVELNENLSRRQRCKETILAMKKGVDLIYQGGFVDERFTARPDFLKKVDVPSSLGNYSYEVWDTKLSLSIKAGSIIQLVHYSEMVSKVQGVMPLSMGLILGDSTEKRFYVKNYFFYFKNLKKRFLDFTKKNNFKSLSPSPCQHCDLCYWRNYCNEIWKKEDHLCQTAFINKSQIKKLNSFKINTMKELSEFDRKNKIPELNQTSLLRLQQQASLQVKSRETGRNYFELIKKDEVFLNTKDLHTNGRFGLQLLPKPSIGDLFFDMESDPFSYEKLEYLFGVFYFIDGTEIFKSFWALSHDEERNTFKNFIGFLKKHLREFPLAHIYHYAPYEKEALRRLSNKYDIEKEFVDNLLRKEKLVDLYKIVRESIRISEPKYSIKNLEKFYSDKFGDRTGSVISAADSVIYFEDWKNSGESKNSKILDEIENYNLQDVRSTYFLRQWLLEIMLENKIEHSPIFTKDEDKIELSDKAKLYAKELGILKNKLESEIDTEQFSNNQELNYKRILIDLLDFHKRDQKPQWWTYFDRIESSVFERIDRDDCIVQIIEINPINRVEEKKSYRFYCSFIKQNTNIKTGDNCIDLSTRTSIYDVNVDREKNILNFKKSSKILPKFPIDIGLSGPVENTEVLTKSIFRYAENTNSYPAITALLSKSLPVVRGGVEGSALINDSESIDQIKSLVTNLINSVVFIQGPPGTGKTYLGSQLIVDLLSKGKKLGVISNSHKAIINMLDKVECCAYENNFYFSGAKKSSKFDLSQQYSNLKNNSNSMIKDFYNNKEIITGNYQLMAGTAWFFADPLLDKKLDYLVVDEAGQLSLATLIAAATSSMSIILIGDQNQLEQPIQGIHPNDSGISAINYLLKTNKQNDIDAVTVPDNRGIFLKKTYRLHPTICSFISEAFYQSRLIANNENLKRKLVLEDKTSKNLITSGIKLISVKHNGCKQHSKTEVDLVSSLFTELLCQKVTNEKNQIRPIKLEDILVVAPYNLQVQEIKKVLPDFARVGTIDKFQGQEAEIVIISMTTSDAESMPRDIEFLLSKNRLNVAITRARCLVLLIVSKHLLLFPCKTPEAMELVNTLCWLNDQYG